MTTIDLGIAGISGATCVGHGGFGVVYRAWQDAMGRTVAVKILNLPAITDEARARFDSECRALGALSGHPNIVAVFECGTLADRRPFLLMDHLPGGTLAERVRRDGPLPWELATAIAVKLAGALASAHTAGVLHRDMKPENVLMSAYDEPQVVDFGIARLAGGSRSRSAVFSLAHAAPEVLAGQRAGETSDVYSLASTVYELLAGNAPFVRPSDESFHAVLGRALAEDPPDLRPKGVPEPLWEVLRAALEKDPDARTPSAHALAEALRRVQRALGQEATPAVVPSEQPCPAVTVVPDADDRRPPTAFDPLQRSAPGTVAAARTGARVPEWVLPVAAAMLAAILVIAGLAWGLGGGDAGAARFAAAPVADEPVSTAQSGAPAQDHNGDGSSGAPAGDAPVAYPPGGAAAPPAMPAPYRAERSDGGARSAGVPPTAPGSGAPRARPRRERPDRPPPPPPPPPPGPPPALPPAPPPAPPAQRFDVESPGRSVQECWLFRGTAVLPAGRTLVVGVRNLAHGDGRIHFETVVDWQGTVGQGAWSRAQWFGSGDSSVGQSFAVGFLSVEQSTLAAVPNRTSSTAWHAAANPPGAEALKVLAVQREPGEGSC